MNPVIKKKLDQFENMIHGAINDQNEQIKAQTDQYQSDQVERRQEELKVEAEAFYKKRMLQTEDAVKHIVSGAEMAARRDALEMRKAILQETVEALQLRAAAFVKTPQYRDMIERKLDGIGERLATFESLVISANQADVDWLKQYFEKRKCAAKLVFNPLDEAAIGGIVVEVPEAYFRYNITLKSMIDDSIDHIGAKLYVLFEEMEN